MRFITLDTEVTGAINDTFGNPFSSFNRLVYVGLCVEQEYRSYSVEFLQRPFGQTLQIIRDQLVRIPKETTLVGFNLKFDLHWLRRYNCLDWDNLPTLWDCQLAHFILRGQKGSYPSLNQALEYYGLPQKLDIVKTEYWDKGIDTDQVPEGILQEYLEHDVRSTEQVFQRQREELKDLPSKRKRIIWEACQDLKLTAEMEWNGLKYDIEKSIGRGDGIKQSINEFDSNLNSMFDSLPINWNSGDHLSCVLYGGTIKVPVKETYLFTYKDGRTKEKERWAERSINFTRLVEPLKNTELKKEGYWSTSEGILLKLKAKGKAKEIIDLVLKRSKLEKKVGTYYHGFPKLYESMGWEDNILHSNLNHCVAETGRLSSTKPNIQNLEEEMRECVVSRF